MKAKSTAKKSNTSKVKPREDILSWFEIPVVNLDRAMLFYKTILNIEFDSVLTGAHTMAFFPVKSGIGGALVYGDGCVPSHTGTLLYLNAGNDLDSTLSKVANSGGHILMGKSLIREDIGFYSLILDSEGNRLSLYSKP